MKTEHILSDIKFLKNANAKSQSPIRKMKKKKRFVDTNSFPHSLLKVMLSKLTNLMAHF